MELSENHGDEKVKQAIHDMKCTISKLVCVSSHSPKNQADHKKSLRNVQMMTNQWNIF